MAVIELTVQETSQHGISLETELVNGGGNFFRDPGQDCALLVVNEATSGRTISIQTPQTVDGLATEDREVAVPAGATMLIGPLGEVYHDSTGWVRVFYPDPAGLSVAVIRVGATF